MEKLSMIMGHQESKRGCHFKPVQRMFFSALQYHLMVSVLRKLHLGYQCQQESFVCDPWESESPLFHFFHKVSVWMHVMEQNHKQVTNASHPGRHPLLRPPMILRPGVGSRKVAFPSLVSSIVVVHLLSVKAALGSARSIPALHIPVQSTSDRMNGPIWGWLQEGCCLAS